MTGAALGLLATVVGRFRYKLLGYLQRQCRHPAEAVSADIAEGDIPEWAVAWCRICGATQLRWQGGQSEWRVPRADWWLA